MLRASFCFIRYAELRGSHCFAMPASTNHRHVPPNKNDPFGSSLFGGEGEIRTRGELPHACFQDKYLKPLGHLSVQGLILTEVGAKNQVYLDICAAGSTTSSKACKYKVNYCVSKQSNNNAYDCVKNRILCSCNCGRITTRNYITQAADDDHDD